MGRSHAVMHVLGASFLCLAPCFAAWAADADDIAELKRAIEVLQEENRALAKRLATLEAEKSESGQQKSAGSESESRALAKRPATLEAETSEREEPKDPGSPPATAPATVVGSTEQERLEQRVRELEIARTAQEDAVRSIVRDSFSKMGSKINEFVNLGGILEVQASRSRDFAGVSTNEILLSTAELDLEVQVNPWALGTLVLSFDQGTSVLFPTTSGFQAGVDRLTVSKGYMTLGDTQRFPAFLDAGKLVLPFGISTGRPVADTLSTSDPLTVQVFETRRTAIGLGLAFPTPALVPPTPPVYAPRVRPLVIEPLISSVSRHIGYDPPPTRPPRPNPLAPPFNLPPFQAAVYVYEGETQRPLNHVDATVGYRAKGNCDRPYYELRDSMFCPWAFDVSVDYNSSIFDSDFLSTEYQAFLGQIGLVGGMAASIKSRLGPFGLVLEWNGAIERAKFVNGLAQPVNMKPSAWQVSLGYQFDWNPWVEEIGLQGDFVSVGYSESRDLAGVPESSVQPRVGFVPKRRLLLTAGEWVADGVRVTVEFARNWDYAVNQGGTGKIADGVFTTFTFVW